MALVIGGLALVGSMGSLIYWMIQRYLNKETIKEELLRAPKNETLTKHGVTIRIVEPDCDVNITTVLKNICKCMHLHIFSNVSVSYRD